MRFLGVLVSAAAAIALGVGLAAAAYWLWTQTQGGPGARPVAAAGVEACGYTLAGSNTIGERLAPKLLEALLESERYDISAAQTVEPEVVRVGGVREGRPCTVTVLSHGSSEAFDALLTGAAQIGMSSRQITPREIEALRVAGAGDFAADAPIAEHVIALDGIATITHPSNPLTRLPLLDVKRAFLGQVTDWSALGAAAGPIKLHARDDMSGTFQFFHEQVLEKDPRWAEAAAGAKRFASSSELVAAVAADPQALGFVGAAYVTPAVKALAISAGGPAYLPVAAEVRSEHYPISRRLFLYVRPEVMRANAFARNFVSFAKSAAAYDVVEELGYISLRPIGQGGPAQAQTEAPELCTPGSAEASAYRTATAGAQRLDSVIRFIAASDTLDSLARDDIGRAAPAIRAALGEGARVSLIGHSDGAGDAAVNRKLALDRAATVRTAFEAEGLFGLQIESAGEMCPVADNATEPGRRSNRRVEIWVAQGA